MAKNFEATIRIDKIVSGGQGLGTLDDGKKAFVWNALPGETVRFATTKVKSSYVEGVSTEILSPSPERTTPRDEDSFLSTSPWQVVSFAAEQSLKAQLVDEAFSMHHVASLPNASDFFSDGHEYAYRNKVEFSFYGDTDESGRESLSLAFFRRGSAGKIKVKNTSLARPEINALAERIRAALEKKNVSARELKTLLIRCSQTGQCVWQLYTKTDKLVFDGNEMTECNAQGGEVIYSDPRSPASRITKRVAAVGDVVLHDTVLGVPFNYACEGFFQVNLPVYEQALRDMKQYVGDTACVDMYSGVGTIGLTIGGQSPTLVEVDENAVREMKRNIASLGSRAHAVLAPSEKALECISAEKCIVVDPPRAGLHADVVEKLRLEQPPRLLYLSCNPVTQARDFALLSDLYRVAFRRGYNFFPRTPHIEHLLVLDRR